MTIELRRTLTKLGLGIATMFGLYWLYSFFVAPVIGLQQFKSIIGMVVLYGIGLPLFILISGRTDVRSAGEKSNLSLKLVIGFCAMQITAVLAMLAVNLAVTLLNNRVTDDSISMLDPFKLFLLLIFNPVAEEFVFRKLLADKLRQYGDRLFILASAFCFSIAHGVALGVPQIVYTFILGLIWAYVYVKTNSFVWVVILHSLSNLLAGIFSDILKAITPAGELIYLVYTLVFGIFGFWVFLRNRGKANIEGGSVIITAANIKILFTNPGILAYIALVVIMMIYKGLFH